MLDQVFRRTAVRERLIGNPLGLVLQQYVGYLVARGHRTGTVHQYVFVLEDFGEWRKRRPINRAAVERFIRRRQPQRRGVSGAGNINTVRAALNRLLDMLAPTQPAPTCRTLAERLLEDYASHLEGVCGLSPATIRYRLRYVRALLRRWGVRRRRQLRAWSPAQIAQSIAAVGRLHKPSSGQVLACSIRSFLRFLLAQGLITRDLAAAVPSFANWRLASLPAVVDYGQLERLVAAVDASTPIGMRDRAILLCLTPLGLRACDVAGLRIEDVDLDARVLHLRRPKQRDRVAAPISNVVARAIGLYVRLGRPACTGPWLFVMHRAPVGQRLASIGVRDVVIRRAAEAGLAGQICGTHVIRHSVATALINRGASIKLIADFLGHRSIDTTSIYAKVDLRSLSRVALPWPTAREVTP